MEKTKAKLKGGVDVFDGPGVDAAIFVIAFDDLIMLVQSQDAADLHSLAADFKNVPQEVADGVPGWESAGFEVLALDVVVW